MRVLIQRVISAKVRKVHPYSNKISPQDEESAIEKGLLLLIGVGRGDSEDDARELAEKIFHLRIFENNGKFDFSLADIKGEVLAIPQFTLYGKTDKGRRPEFTQAERPDQARKIFDFFCDYLNKFVPCKRGFFGEKMEVELINDGPVTLMLEQ
ncbi:MAG: D-aminoacyl-tRNA deacylase [candidate division WOR-3 bacterium]|nr:D-aminoacyl-tRNA deacylase [candidate division WOR-3 bacterium]